MLPGWGIGGMAMAGTNANGHRRRELVKRVRAQETRCALCDKPVDKTLARIAGQHGPKCPRIDCNGCAWHPESAVVDEDVPRVRGGSPTQRSNCHLMHRACNRWKSTMTLAEAKAKRAGDAAERPQKSVSTSTAW